MCMRTPKILKNHPKCAYSVNAIEINMMVILKNSLSNSPCATTGTTEKKKSMIEIALNIFVYLYKQIKSVSIE